MSQLFVSTTPGLERALVTEVRALGLSPKEVVGGCEVEGDFARLNLWLRTASRVLLRVGSFEARDEKELRRGLASVRWSEFHRGTHPVDCGASSEKCRLRPKQVEELVARELGGQGEPELSVQLRGERDVWTVSVDTSGELLHRRGYRQEGSHAPLRESLAAGVLLLAGYDGSAPLVDPMCGSGTLVIEAALMACRRAPGLERAFAFERFPSFEPQRLEAEKARARAVAVKPAFKLYGSDIHAGALGAARRNARRAEVGELVEWQRVDVRVRQRPVEQGFVVVNPPYGKRVGERGELSAVFAALGKTMRERFRGFRYGVLVPDPALESHLGLAGATVTRVQNGGIWCRLLTGVIR